MKVGKNGEHERENPPLFRDPAAGGGGVKRDKRGGIPQQRDENSEFTQINEAEGGNGI